MNQAQRDAIATAVARRDALLAEAEVFAARGAWWDADVRRKQAAEYETHRLAVLLASGDVAVNMAEAGFSVVETGGGCQAYELTGDTGYTWVTSYGDPSLPEAMDGEAVAVGVYAGPEGELVLGLKFASLRDFLTAHARDF